MWVSRVLVFLLRKDGFLGKAKQDTILPNTRNVLLPLWALSAVEEPENLKIKYTAKIIDLLNRRANAACDRARPQSGPPLPPQCKTGLRNCFVVTWNDHMSLAWPVPSPGSNLTAQSLLQGRVMAGVTPGSSEPGRSQLSSAPHPIASHHHLICTSPCLPTLVS